MSHILGKYEDRAVSGGWEDLESCVTSAVEVVLSLHVFHSWWFDQIAAGEWIDRRQQELPQLRLISEFGYDFLLSWCWLVLVLVFLWLTRGSMTLVATEGTRLASSPDLQLWNWPNVLCSIWARQGINSSGWCTFKMTGLLMREISLAWPMCSDSVFPFDFVALSPNLLTWQHKLFLLHLTLTSHARVIRKGFRLRQKLRSNLCYSFNH